MDFEKEITELKQAVADIQVVMPLIRALAASPGLVQRIAQDGATAADAVGKLAADIATVARAVEAVSQHPALDVPPLRAPQADSYESEKVR